MVASASNRYERIRSWSCSASAPATARAFSRALEELAASMPDSTAMAMTASTAALTMTSMRAKPASEREWGWTFIVDFIGRFAAPG